MLVNGYCMKLLCVKKKIEYRKSILQSIFDYHGLIIYLVIKPSSKKSTCWKIATA